MVAKRGDFEHTVQIREIRGLRVPVKVYSYPLAPVPAEEVQDGEEGSEEDGPQAAE
jgi:hypothetical protein